MLFNSAGDRLVGTRVGHLPDRQLHRRADGRLVAAPGSPFTAQGSARSAEFRPTNPSQLFVTNAHNGPGLGTVSAFHVSRDGDLRSIGDSRSRTARPRRAGSRSATTANTSSPSTRGPQHLPVRHRGRDGSLTLIGSTVFRHGGPARSTPACHRAAKFLFVDGGADVVSAFAVNGGDLTELASRRRRCRPAPRPRHRRQLGNNEPLIMETGAPAPASTEEGKTISSLAAGQCAVLAVAVYFRDPDGHGLEYLAMRRSQSHARTLGSFPGRSGSRLGPASTTFFGGDNRPMTVRHRRRPLPAWSGKPRSASLGGRRRGAVGAFVQRSRASPSPSSRTSPSAPSTTTPF